MQEPLDPDCSGFFVPVFDTATRINDLVRAHGRIADEYKFVIGTVLVRYICCWNSLGVSPPIIFPHALVYKIVKVEIFEMLELTFRRRKHFFANPYMVIHRTADIEA